MASKPRVGENSLIMGAVLENLDNGLRVGYFSDTLRQEQIRGRLVVLKSKVNGCRSRAGVVRVEDHQQLHDARASIAWNQLLIRSAKEISLRDVASGILLYRSTLVIADSMAAATGLC